MPQTEESYNARTAYIGTLVAESLPATIAEFSVQLNGYRFDSRLAESAYGHVVIHKIPREGSDDTGIVLWRDQLSAPESATYRDAHKPIYLVSIDGGDVQPYYVAGWAGDGGDANAPGRHAMYLQPLRHAPDGPRRAYTLRVSTRVSLWWETDRATRERLTRTDA